MTTDEQFTLLRERLLVDTREKLVDAVNDDILIMQSLATIDDLSTQINSLSKRLREWFGYILPELCESITDNEAFVRIVASKPLADLVLEFAPSGSMGKHLTGADYDAVHTLAKSADALIQTKSDLVSYLGSLLSRSMPNVRHLVGVTIGARLLSSAGSLRALAMLPASTVQLLGAEKALFRHLKTGARTPKHGYIVNHPLVQKANRADTGKVARGLADKISLCAKIDYFKGGFIAEEYLTQLRKKFGGEE